MKKITSLILTSVIITGILAGCATDDTSSVAPNDASDTTQNPKTELVFANYRDLRDPNPHLYQGEMWAQEMIFETLVSVGESGDRKSVV